MIDATISATRLVSSPRSSACSRERRRTRAIIGRMMSASTGAATIAISVSRHDSPSKIATYTTMRLTLRSSEASAAVTAVFT